MKQQNPLVVLLEFFIIAAISFFVVNVGINYLFLAVDYFKLSKGQTSTEHIFDFKLEYLYSNKSNVDTFAMVGISMIISFFIVKRLDESWKVRHGNEDLKGDDHFMTLEELKEDKGLYSFDTKDMHSAEKSGLPIALEGTRLFIAPDTVHSLIIGTTRSGKGQTFVLPMIRQIAMSKAKHSIVANDPKGELLENTYQLLKDEGYNILVLNLRDTNLSSLWNPLQIIIDEYVKAMESDKDLSKTIKLVQSLAALFTDNPKSDPIWPDSARSLLVSIILLLLEKGYETDQLDKVNLYSVNNFLIEYGTTDKTVVENRVPKTINALDEIFKALPIGNPAKSAYSTSNFAKGEMRSSIFSTLSSNINIFATDMGISKLTSGNQIDFNCLIDPDKPCAIFMIVPDEDTSRHVIASLFVNQCYNNLVEVSSQFPNQILPQRVHFELDEFGNMVRIPAMDTKITVGAGRNLLFELYVQDLNQLDSKYDNAAKTIRSNCGNLVYINSLDKETNEYMSAVLGNETINFETYSGELSAWLKNRNINVEAKPLMTATQLSKMQFGETVIKRQRAEPVKTKFEPFYKLKIKPTPITEIPMDLVKVDLNEVMFPILDFYKEIHWNDEEEKQPETNPAAARAMTRPGAGTRPSAHKPALTDADRMRYTAQHAAVQQRQTLQQEKQEKEAEGRPPLARPSVSADSIPPKQETPVSLAVSPSPPPLPPVTEHTEQSAVTEPTPTEQPPVSEQSEQAVLIAETDTSNMDFNAIAELIATNEPSFIEAYNAAAYDDCIAIAHKLKIIKKLSAEQEEFIISYLSQY
ncbi:MAG: type IV secretory system conjugative DNA transfer family protein [Eubacterium sp.]|nr:type IV secretory system conjugative DNA transfer family protein [Eubacterium sp.]